MAGLQDTISRATRNLGNMTLSQRLAVGMGVMLVAGSLFWLAQWAAKPDMAPLLNQALDADELAVLRTGLDAMGEPYTVEGSQLMVRATANRPAIIAALQQAERMPSDTAASFAELVKEANPWISGQENDRRWTVALQSELARVLRKFNGVKQASVILNLNARPRGFSQRESEATASVTLFSQGGEPISRSLALAAARMVAGAVRGLPVKNVEVIDGSSSRAALDWEGVEDGGASNLHRQRRQLEQDKALQIREQLSFDPHALVSVSAELDYSSVQENNLTVSEGIKVETENDNVTTSRNALSGQPGAQPNTGMSVGEGGGVENSSTSTRKHDVTEPSRLTSVKQTPAGVPKTISAAVSLSRSYLAGIYQRNNPESESPPTDEQIVEIFNKQKDAIVTLLSKLTIPQDAEQVSLAWHHDVEPAVAEASGALDTSLELAGRYGPASGLGLLALVALGMMFKMSKQKGGGESFGMEIGLPADAIEAAKNAAENLRTSSRRGPRGAGGGAGARAGDGSYGRASNAAIEPEPMAPIPVGQGAEGVLEAREVNESDVQISHMVEQVASMTDEDGDAVASLIENWIDNSG